MRIDKINKLENNLMIDIECLKKGSNPVITSIGAVQFNLETGEIGEKFKKNISIQSSLSLGCGVDGDTIEWWFSQEPAAQQAMLTDTYSVGEVMYELTAFIQSLKPSNLRVWGNGARFDLGAISQIYELLKKQIPWKYSMERDVRTLVDLMPEVKDEFLERGMTGVYHDAVDDCIFQIEYCAEIWRRLTERPG